MRATGIVRRIDDLGRLVIPKETRRIMRIREGDPLEIFTGENGEIVLRKYSPIGEMGQLAGEYVEAMASVFHCTVCVSDRDEIVAAAGPDKSAVLGKEIHEELMESIEYRDNLVASKEDARFCEIIKEPLDVYAEAISTIVCQGDAIGSVVIYTKKPDRQLGETEEKMARCGAAFLARQMEQ